MSTRKEQLRKSAAVQSASQFLVDRGFQDLTTFSVHQVVDLLCEYRVHHPDWSDETFHGPRVDLSCGCTAVSNRPAPDANQRATIETLLRGLPCAHSIACHPPLNLRVAVVARNCECEYRATLTVDDERVVR